MIHSRSCLPTLFLAAGLVAGCGDSPVSTSVPVRTEEARAKRYLTAALDTMQAHSINRYRVDWSPLRAEALARIAGATTTEATYPTIDWALDQLGDNHSFLRRPSSQQFLLESPAGLAWARVLPSDGTMASATGNPEPTTAYLGQGIGYLLVPWFSGGEGTVEMASLYHQEIEDVDTLGVCGWVVDLRGNMGGNMWPMLAGVGPILGDGTAGYFIDPDTLEQRWGYSRGESWIEGWPQVSVPVPYRVRNTSPPVAVLTDGLTASSGEAITVAFRARPDTRSFGQGTYGVSTANRAFPLSDGAVIYLTVSTMADRTREMYGGVIEPDVFVAPDTPGTVIPDGVLDAGVTWLAAQPACAGQG